MHPDDVVVSLKEGLIVGWRELLRVVENNVALQSRINTRWIRRRLALAESLKDLPECFTGATAEAQGRWTREAPTEAGWYFVHDPFSGVTSIANLAPGEQYEDELRWSLPIQLPPPPTEARET